MAACPDAGPVAGRPEGYLPAPRLGLGSSGQSLPSCLMISGNEPADDRQPSRGTAGQLFSCLIWHGTGHQACGPCRDLRPAGEAEPGQDVRHVAGHRWSAQAQAPGDGRIGQDRGHQFRHFDLARGKASASLGVAATPGGLARPVPSGSQGGADPTTPRSGPAA